MMGSTGASALGAAVTYKWTQFNDITRDPFEDAARQLQPRPGARGASGRTQDQRLSHVASQANQARPKIVKPIHRAFALLAIILAGHTICKPRTRYPRGTMDPPSKPSWILFARPPKPGRKVCPAGGTHRHLRPGRHTLGRASDVHPGHVLPGARARAGRKETGTQEDRAIQDRALRQSGRLSQSSR